MRPLRRENHGRGMRTGRVKEEAGPVDPHHRHGGGRPGNRGPEHGDRGRSPGRSGAKMRPHHRHGGRSRVGTGPVSGRYGHHGESSLDQLKDEAHFLKERLHSVKMAIKEMENGEVKSRVTAKINTDLCMGCGRCVDACKHGAVTVNDVAVIDEDICAGCGHCISRCPENAISI